MANKNKKRMAARKRSASARSRDVDAKQHALSERDKATASRKRAAERKAAGGKKSSAVAPERTPRSIPEPESVQLRAWGPLTAAAVAALAVFVWAYWPTLEFLVEMWEKHDDYSHGYLVVPIALAMIVYRRGSFPGFAHKLAWPGLMLIGLSILVRMTSALVFVEPMDGWSILLWVGGVVWFLCGWRVFCWSLPAIGFLLFMIPLPYQVEHMMRVPLQQVATVLSGWSLQTFGLPALAEGNTILIGDTQLEVEKACSGLRIFTGIVALAYAYMVFVPRSWWERGILVLSILPIALLANVTRIVVTGMLYSWTNNAVAEKFTHDFAGWVMIPYAALLFALVLWYLRRAFPYVEKMDVAFVVRREAPT